MSLPTPRLEIYPSRIEENARSIVALCHKHNIQVAGVTKVSCAHPAVVQALVSAGVDMLADSRIENLEAIRQMGTTLPLMLTRIPTPSHADRVVELADISLNSSYETIGQLSAAAQKQKKAHKVILMVDLGDLREGVWPDHLIEIVEKASLLPNIELIGLGSNLACYGGVIPTHEKMQMLIALRDQCQSTLGLDLPILSGGNSSNLPLLASGGMPPEINHLRVGEAIQLGRNVINRDPWPGTCQDTYKIIAEVIELERKPSIPIGEYGQDAFGGNPQFVDRGIRLRAICNIGRQDVNIDNL
ncbi:alanine/ornithine racemase family PLP-dependent enzyme, partial [bacterium]|nr:alanine/ornithine racemase family PLP-dependent enzyme [bacterium]